MSDLNTLLVNIRNAIYDYGDLQTWCTSNYSRNHKVYVGLDTRNPPGQSDYPMVAIFPWKQSQGYGKMEQRHEFEIVVGLYDTALRAVAGKSGIIEKNGIQNLEAMRALVSLAIQGADIDDNWLNDLDTEYDPVEYFPFFLGSSIYKLSTPYYQGDDPLL